MSSSRFKEVRRFLTVAKQRYEEARFLLGKYDSVAIYLAGYTVECALKALLLSAFPERKHPEIVHSFRGRDGHSYENLKVRYIRKTRSQFPSKIANAFSYVNYWTTDLRYQPGTTPPNEAQLFLRYTEEIIVWTNGRM